VQFRAGNVFYCKQFPCTATWQEVEGIVQIDWGKFGKYEMRPQADGSLVGSVLGKPDDWRKAYLVREFTPAEELLSASAWMLHHEGGPPFRVEFHADGHFHAPSYPGHHTYQLQGTTVNISWGKYGNYTLELNVAERTAAGSLTNNPASWRRLTYVEPLAAHIFKEHGCGHAH